MKPNKPNRHSERNAAELRNLFFNRPQLFCLLLVLMFIAVGCEEKLTKPPEVTKPAGPPELTKSLHQAVADGDIEQVKFLISKSAEVSAKDDYGQTALHRAVLMGHRDVVEFLVANGASIDPKDNAGRTPLHYAAWAGQRDAAQLLLDNGAHINARDNHCWTPLHYATRRRHKVIVKLLIARRVDLNATTDRGHTAFSLAKRLTSMHNGHPGAVGAATLWFEIADLLHRNGTVYYVAVDGKDSNPGTFEYPFRTLSAAVNIAEPSDIIFVRGGVHSCLSTIHIDKSGQAGSPICLMAYPAESPVFDFSAAKGYGFYITGAYWHIKGLTVTKTEHCGIRLETERSNHNILEQIIAHTNGLTGIALFNGAAHNLVINCDSYRNFDPESNGENADGFDAARGLGPGNLFLGCRGWSNADDGFDCVHTDQGVRMESCYAWRNGENIWDHPIFNGDGGGFKVSSGQVPHVLIRCAAWNHKASLNISPDIIARRNDMGFTCGSNRWVRFLNCTALGNKLNYRFWSEDRTGERVLRNNLSYEGRVRINPKVNDQFNSWNTPPGVEITKADFLSLDDSVITGPRNPDGSIPESDFLRLAPDSDAIDAGMDVGLSFTGKAPDLGAFEYVPQKAKRQSSVKWLHQAVRDHDVQKMRALFPQGTDINEKDWLGYAPLHWACYFGYSDVAELLLYSGANPNLISDTGRTPLEIAKAMVYDKIAELLRKHGAKE